MIEIFEGEINDGLEKAIAENRTIAYFTEVQPLTVKERESVTKASLEELLKLGINDFNDANLYYNKSILVSTGWNLNDDIFDKMEVIKARKTPKNKPSNLNHNEKLIVGHMTDVWTIDEFGEVLPDNVDSPPDFFHLLTNNVIYLHWEDQEYKQQVAELVEKIEKKEKYVSMECLFSAFDYGLVDSNGVNKVVARKQDTSFLTKFLRAYGGTGIYKGMKIGRLLKNINFSAKGYVDKPANPNSVIFSEGDFFKFNSVATLHDLNDFGVMKNKLDSILKL